MKEVQVSSTSGAPERKVEKSDTQPVVNSKEYGLPLEKESCPPSRNEYQDVGHTSQQPSPFSLSHNRLYGRDQEEQLLLQAYERAITTPSSELVLISGPSGTGKTTLARTLRKQKGFFLSGKFEEMSQEPYAVFVEALTEYADRMYDTSPQRTTFAKRVDRQHGQFRRRTLDGSYSGANQSHGTPTTCVSGVGASSPAAIPVRLWYARQGHLYGASAGRLYGRPSVGR